MDYSDYTPNPETMSRVCFDAIPDELKARRQWVVWRSEADKQGKPTKVPYQAIGEGKASTDEPDTWATFPQAVRRYSEREDADGIGFVFTEDDAYTGVDLDHCIVDGRLTDYAAEYVKGLDSYTEVSPSGSGLHIITYAILPYSKKTEAIELYDRGRYFTMTGKRWPGTRPDITDRQGAIDIILTELNAADDKPSRTEASQTPRPVTTLSLDDRDIIERARRAENGAKFSALFDRGDTSGYGGDDSRADLALCSLIAFYTQDPNQIYRIVRQSALWRDKWDEVHRQRGGPATYAEMTIEKALNRSEVYTPPVPVTLVNGKASQPSQASNTPTRGNLALAPADDHTETTTARGSEPIKLRMADVWQRDLLTLGRLPDVPPQREYVLDMLPVPSVNLWTGLPGGKKSLLLMDASISEASGGIWLPRKGGENVPYGDVQGQGRPVLWIDYDMGRDLTSERFYAMARHRGIEDLSSIPLHVLSVSAPMDLYNLQHAEELTEFIRRLGAKFVVIDTLIDVKGAARENEDSMGVVFSNLRRISQEARASINVIHHPAKNGSPETPYRGFSGIAGKLDLGVTLAKRGYELTEPVDVSAFKVRGAPPKPFSAMFQYETHSSDWRTLWTASFVAIAPPAGVVGPQAIRDTFRDVLTQDPDLGKTDLIKKVYLKLMGQKVSRAQVEAEYYALLSDNQVSAEATGEKNKTAHRWVDGDE